MKKHRTILAGMLAAGCLLLGACAPAGEGSVSGLGAGTDYNALLEKLPANPNPSLSNFQTVTMAGDTVSQELFADHKLTMINIWATFCTPCIREMPDLGEISKEYAEKGVQVVGVIADVQAQDGSISEQQMDTAREIVSKIGADYPHLLPSYDLLAAKLAQVTAVPETIFVDSSGRQVGDSYAGARSKEEWTATIEQLLGQVS